MTFTARLRRNSHIWTAWHNRHAVSGEIGGVAFRWVPGGDYVTGDLTAGQVAALRGEPEAVLEMFGTEPPADDKIDYSYLLPGLRATPTEPPVITQEGIEAAAAAEAAEADQRSKGAQRVAEWRKRQREARQQGTG